MDFEKYKNRLPFARRKDNEHLWRAYQEEQGRLDAEFKQDALNEAGLAAHPARDVIYAEAWSRGHSGGYSEVFNCLLNLVDFTESWDQALLAAGKAKPKAPEPQGKALMGYRAEGEVPVTEHWKSGPRNIKRPKMLVFVFADGSTLRVRPDKRGDGVPYLIVEEKAP